MKEITLHKQFKNKIRRTVKRAYSRKHLRIQNAIQTILGVEDWEEVLESLKVTFEKRYGIELTAEILRTTSLHHKIFLETANTIEEVTKLNHHTNFELLTTEDHNELHHTIRWERHEKINASNTGSQS